MWLRKGPSDDFCEKARSIKCGEFLYLSEEVSASQGPCCVELVCLSYCECTELSNADSYDCYLSDSLAAGLDSMYAEITEMQEILWHIIGLSQFTESENALYMTLFSAERWEFASIVSWTRSGFPCFLCYRIPAVNLTFVVGPRFTSDSKFSATACIPLSANDMQFTCDA